MAQPQRRPANDSMPPKLDDDIKRLNIMVPARMGAPRPQFSTAGRSAKLLGSRPQAGGNSPRSREKDQALIRVAEVSAQKRRKNLRGAPAQVEKGQVGNGFHEPSPKRERTRSTCIAVHGLPVPS